MTTFVLCIGQNSVCEETLFIRPPAHEKRKSLSLRRNRHGYDRSIIPDAPDAQAGIVTAAVARNIRVTKVHVMRPRMCGVARRG